MQLPQLNNPELQSFFDQTRFIEATVAQINKDLQGLFYGDFSFIPSSEKNPLEQLVTQLVPIITDLSKRQPEQLAQFIYRVDLPEKKFVEAITEDSALQLLAFRIIEREALKVYLRMKFS